MAGCECEDLVFAKMAGLIRWWKEPGWWMINFYVPQPAASSSYRCRIRYCFKCGEPLTPPEEASDV